MKTKKQINRDYDSTCFVSLISPIEQGVSIEIEKWRDFLCQKKKCDQTQ